MNQYNILNSFLFIKNKTTKLLTFDNYFYKLLFITYFPKKITKSKNYKLDFELNFK
jgi:hypothetical protein